MNNWNLTGKKALVTGGSKGIGKAIVKELAELGASVLFTGRNTEELSRTEKEFKNQGFDVSTIAGDVAVASQRNKVGAWIETNWKKLDILVNNAGINIRKRTIDYTSEEYRRVIETDLLAPFEFCRSLYPLLVKSGRASIINISSVAALFEVRTGSPYGMAKSGLLQLSRNLASEWANDGIRVNSLSPWVTDTPLTKVLMADQERMNTIISRTPLKRVAKDAEMAAVVAFLAMEKSSYLTGQNIIVDGGATTVMM